MQAGGLPRLDVSQSGSDIDRETRYASFMEFGRDSQTVEALPTACVALQHRAPSESSCRLLSSSVSSTDFTMHRRMDYGEAARKSFKSSLPLNSRQRHLQGRKSRKQCTAIPPTRPCLTAARNINERPRNVRRLVREKPENRRSHFLCMSATLHRDHRFDPINLSWLAAAGVDVRVDESWPNRVHKHAANYDLSQG